MARLPDVGEAVAPLLAAVPRERQPLLVALAERVAAGRYRAWADADTRPDARAALLGCAAREEDIAERIESLFPDAAAQQRALAEALPDLETRYRALFEGLSTPEQWTVQARGERLGAATWRAFAVGAEASAREVYETCAGLEEDNAATLEELLAR